MSDSDSDSNSSTDVTFAVDGNADAIYVYLGSSGQVRLSHADAKAWVDQLRDVLGPDADDVLGGRSHGTGLSIERHAEPGGAETFITSLSGAADGLGNEGLIVQWTATRDELELLADHIERTVNETTPDELELPELTEEEREELGDDFDGFDEN